MKILKVCVFVFIALIPVIPVVAGYMYENNIESQCIENEIQNGADIEFAKTVCIHS